MARQGKPEWLRQCVLAGKSFSYKTKTPWKHNLINLSVFFGVWALIGATAAAGAFITNPLLYVPVATCVFGYAFFCLYILVIHEASHGMLILAGTRKQRLFWNRLFAWPISLLFITHYKKLWEVGHLEHHVRPIEEDDPQSLNRITGPRLFTGIMALLLIPGYVLIQRVFVRAKLQQKGSSWWVPVVGVLMFGGMLALAGVFISPWVSLALLMGVQLLSALNELKGALEHGGAIAFHPEPLMRSRTSFFPGRHLIMPLNISLHFEHHLNHTVPWYELMNYHHAILPLVPEELRDNIFNTSLMPQLRGELPAPMTESMREAFAARDEVMPAAAE